MWRRSLMWLAGVAGVGFSVSFAFALWVVGSPQGLVPAEDLDTALRLAPGAELSVTFVFNDGLAGSTLVTEVPAELVGLSAAELQAVRPEWTLVSFSAERLAVEQACSEPAGGFLREEDGEVVVYAGRPDACYRPVGTVHVDLEALSPLQRAELAAGIVFGSDGDLSLLLDGMQAP